MTEKKVWLITGEWRAWVSTSPSRPGHRHAVVATGRDGAKVAAAVGEHDNLLAIKARTSPAPRTPQAAVEAAVGKFADRHLVNNAGNFFAGFSRS